MEMISLEQEEVQPIDITTDEKQDYMSWGTKCVGIDSFHAFLKESYQSLMEVRVAVLDTGLDLDLDIFQGRTECHEKPSSQDVAY